MRTKLLLNLFNVSFQSVKRWTFGSNVPTRALLILLLSFPFYLLSSQVPQGFNYQAIARDGSGNPVVNATIKVKLSILSDTTGFFASGTGTYLWEEEQTNVKTNAFGMFTLVFGNPSATKIQGSAASFSVIPWSATPLYTGTKIANPTTYKNMGSAKLWSVPYSLVSGTLSSLNKLVVKGNVVSMDSALFEVRNNTGQTVFAVYNEGIRAYVDNGLVKGATKGGFAIGGFGTAKAPSQNLMMISPDSARIYVDETAVKGTKGGFAIGGFNTAKGTLTEFMKITPSNYFIGHNSGQLLTTGVYNSTMGYESGKALATGSNNVFIGYQSGIGTVGGGSNVFIGTQAGNTNSSGNFNIALGRQAGYSTTASSNIFLGDLTAWANSTGYQNVMIGDWAGYHNTLGWQNVFLGAEAGWYNTTGNYNNFMGFESGYRNTSGSYNSFIGYMAGYNNTTGQYNTYLGYQAGYSGASAAGSNNIFMGVAAGYSNTAGHDNLFFGNAAGITNTIGNFNIFIGTESGNLANANFNTFIGYRTGTSTTNGGYNAMVGYNAGFANTTGVNNAYLGYSAGSSCTGTYNTYIGAEAGYYSSTGSNNVYVGVASGRTGTGSDNVFIGEFSGYGELGSNKLVISNNYTGADNLNNALIYGDFSAKYFKVNGQILNSAIRSSGYAADLKNTGGLTNNYGVNITAGSTDGSGTNYMIDFNSGSGAWKGSILCTNGTISTYTVSDARLKENITKSGIMHCKFLMICRLLIMILQSHQVQYILAILHRTFRKYSLKWLFIMKKQIYTLFLQLL
jgi:hypothetical protein